MEQIALICERYWYVLEVQLNYVIVIFAASAYYKTIETYNTCVNMFLNKY